MKLPSATGFALIIGVAFSACQAHTTAGNAPPVASGTPIAASNAPAVASAAPTVASNTPPAASSAPVADAKSKEEAAAAAAELKEHHQHHHLGGLTQFIAMSLDTLGGDEAKRVQVEKLQGELYSCMAPVGAHQQKLLTLLADGVAAGAIDKAKINAAVTQAGSVPGVEQCSVNALNQLHKLLTPAERASLVDKVHAHAEVWQEVNHDIEGHADGQHGQLERLAKDLSLTPEQVEKISAALHTALGAHAGKFDPKHSEAHRQAFAEAFASETFDAKKVMVNPKSNMASHGSTRMAIFYETITPLLTPAQRATLAGHLREHASHQPTAISAK